MTIYDITHFANLKLKEYNLDQKGWRFAFDRAKTRYGCCKFSKRTITVSYNYAMIGSEGDIKDTILHEIAHALAGREAGHGIAWKHVCIRIGARPVRCGKNIVIAQHRYQATCHSCKRVFGMHRKPKASLIRWCIKCGKTHGLLNYIQVGG